VFTLGVHMSKLVIVESPSKSKTIQKYLGKGYEVVSSKGHIRDLSTTGKGGLGIDIEAGFEPKYVINKDKSATVKSLKDLSAKAEVVFLATDPDREGEAISWHLADALNLEDARIKRVIFNEITETAIQQAFDHPRSIDMDLVRSQEARRMLDRIIGFKLSKLLYKKIKSPSAGRVQSVALKLVVEREKQISAFVPEEKWTIKAQFEKDKTVFDAEIDQKLTKLKQKSDVDAVLEQLTLDFQVKSIVEKQGSKTHKYPFITSTLQQEAANKLNFPPKKTMRIAQKLYEGVSVKGNLEGLITYMRTDSTRFSEGFVKEAQSLIHQNYGKEYVGFYSVKNDQAAQDAHEAIRITNVHYSPEVLKDVLNADELKLYSLIYARSLASLMSAPKTKSITVTLTQKDIDFIAKGTKVEFDGYLKVYAKYESNKDKWLPIMQEGEILTAQKVEGIQSFTEPPTRYTEAKLIEAMEKNGIGRPSTYASIIDTIVERNYVTLEKAETSRTKYFKPTDQGFLTDEMLAMHFESFINEKYTKFMEEDLDKIAEGEKTQKSVLEASYEKFMNLYQEAEVNMEKLEPERVGRVCPECGSDLIKRKGKHGMFIACNSFPKCKYKESLETDKNEPVFTGDNCPNCQSPMVEKMGRYGKFIACSNYPTCKTILKKNRVEPTLTGEFCPECGGALVSRLNRFKKPFVGCSNYPKCRYIQKKEKNGEE
jgi:DNA topoisomerase I